MQADYVLNYDVLSRTKEHHLYVMARIKGKPESKGHERPPLNIGVVLDRSGSMAGDKLDHAKKAIEFLIQHLSAQDTFSLVTYDKRVTVNYAPNVVSNKDVISQALQKIKAGSTTNLSGGWLQGCTLVSDVEKKTGQINRVLLLSDGLANEGIIDTARLKGMAKQKRSESITTSTMGVGMGFNEDLMTEMASEGGGAFYFIDDPDQAPTIFAEELRGLLNVVAQNLTITLECSENVRVLRQLNLYSTEQRSGNTAFLLGDLFADEEKTLVLELHVPAMAELGQIEVAKMRFDYDEIQDDKVEHQTLEIPIYINMVSDEDFAKTEPNELVLKQVLLLSAAHARREAMNEADKGNFDSASQILKTAADDIETAPFHNDEDLRTEYNLLREDAVNMELGSQRYDTHTRKTMHSSIAYSTTRIWKEGKMDTVSRMRMGRQALERNNPSPTALMWDDQSIALDKDTITIGRTSSNEIILAEEEISAQHCRISRDGDDFYLEDLQSTNGTFANGGRVVGRFRLSVGDVISVGTTMFMAR